MVWLTGILWPGSDQTRPHVFIVGELLSDLAGAPSPQRSVPECALKPAGPCISAPPITFLDHEFQEILP